MVLATGTAAGGATVAGGSGASFGGIMAGIGGALGGIGTLLGSGLNKSSGYKFHGREYKRQINRHWEQTMKEAKRFGISPLVALGVNPTGGQGFTSTDSGGMDFERMGQGIEKVLRSPYTKELAGIKLEQERARLDNMNLKNVGLRKQISDLDTSTGPPGSGIVESDLPPDPGTARYYTPGIQPFEMVVKKRNGVIDFYPSQNVQDYMSESMIDNWRYRIAKEWEGYKYAVTRQDQNGLRKLRDRLDDLEASHPPRAGHYYSFSLKAGRPIEIRNGKYRSKRLIDARTWNVPRYTGFGSLRNRNDVQQ